MRVPRRLIGFIAVFQSVLFLSHFFLYETWTFSSTGTDSHGALWIKLALGFLSVSFIAASLLAFRYTNGPLRLFYRVAAVWVGLLTFLFSAAVFSQQGPQSPLYPLPPFGVGANMAFRREALAGIGGFDVALGAGTPALAGEDTLALTLILLAGYRIAYEPAALIRHHHRDDLDSLGRQLQGYGVGLTAFYAALLRHRPSVLLALLLLMPAAFGYLRNGRGKRNAPRNLPDGLRLRQRWWMLTGPVAYMRSVRKQARASRR